MVNNRFFEGFEMLFSAFGTPWKPIFLGIILVWIVILKDIQRI
jgi:hypothetical protein